MSDDGVGYCNPPKDKQFKKGKSGNPNGRRPKEQRFALPRQLRKDILCAAEEEVPISTPKGPKRISRQQLIIRTVLQRAAGGNPTAMKLAIQLISGALNERMEANGPVRLLDIWLDGENRGRARLHEIEDPEWDIKKVTKEIY